MDMVHLAIELLILALVFSVMQAERQKAIRLARLEGKVDLLLEKPEINPYVEAGPEVVGIAKAGHPVDPELLGLAKAGRKIEAIKRYREITGLGLKEAKDYVERL